MASRLLVAAVALAVATGCTGVPSGGPARVVRRVPAEDAGPPEPRVIRRLPPNPDPDASPDEIVRNFLIAQNEPLDDYAVARRHLAPQADWRIEGRTVVYAAREVRPPRLAGDRASVVVRLRPLGEVSGTGHYRPRTAPIDVPFRLRLVPNVGWRLADAPPGLYLTRDGLAASFQRATLYWPDQARRLVPDPVFLRAGDQPVAAIVRALLAGPRGWLARSVRTSLPEGTALLSPPEVVGDVVTLRFSREIGAAPQETLAMLVAQLVWTLTELPELKVVRVLAEDEPLDVPGRPGVRDHRREDSAEFAPVPPTSDRRLFFVRGGVAYALDDLGRESRVVTTPALESFAVNRAGTTLAAVTRGADGASLLIVDLTGSRPRDTVGRRADRITTPTWEPSGAFAWSVHTSGATQQIVVVPGGDGLATFVPIPSGLPDPINDLRLSPDGARAVLVAGPPGAATVWVARVERSASGGRVLAEPFRVLPTVRGVTAAAFDGRSQLLVAAFDRRPALYRLDVDGYGVETVSPAGLPNRPVTALAVSAGMPADRVAASDARLWRRAPGAAWAPLRERGRSPSFAG